MLERRRIPRNHLIHYLRLYDCGLQDYVGNLVDISPVGIMMLANQAFAKGTVTHFRMDFPEDVMGKKSLEYDAECVWSRADVNNPDLYAIGFRIPHISQQDIDIIDYLIQEYRD
jgi:hypothetical protein